MKLFINSVFLLSLCTAFIKSQDAETFTLDKPFEIIPFVPTTWSLGTGLAVLPTNDIIVSNKSFITFNLINGILSSDADDVTYYLKNQTSIEYPSYILKQGQAKSGDVSVFKASRNSTLFGRYIGPNISTDDTIGPYNRWVACKNNDNIYTIGWDADIISQPPEGCINYAKYNPGVLLHVNSA